MPTPDARPAKSGIACWTSFCSAGRRSFRGIHKSVQIPPIDCWRLPVESYTAGDCRLLSQVPWLLSRLMQTVPISSRVNFGWFPGRSNVQLPDISIFRPPFRQFRHDWANRPIKLEQLCSSRNFFDLAIFPPSLTPTPASRL